MQSIKDVLALLREGNCYGEKVTLVAATKTRSVEEINRAIREGVTCIGENRVQEFVTKLPHLLPAQRHFIGHLQTNKVKQLIGKVDLYHSLDREELSLELARRSMQAGITSSVLIQINIGNEASKGGYPLEAGFDTLKRMQERKGLKVKGFMAMLPLSEDEGYLGALCDKMYALYLRAKKESADVEYLSMGMSGDFRLCIRHGANMVRLGSLLFGEREY